MSISRSFYKQIKDVHNQYIDTHQRKATFQEIFDAIKPTTLKARTYLRQALYLVYPVHDTTNGGYYCYKGVPKESNMDSQVNLLERIKDPYSLEDTVHKKLIKNDINSYLQEKVGTLSCREKIILILYISEKISLFHISILLHVTDSRVHQYLLNIKKKLRISNKASSLRKQKEYIKVV